jgi:hypothetical protein
MRRLAGPLILVAFTGTDAQDASEHEDDEQRRDDDRDFDGGPDRMITRGGIVTVVVPGKHQDTGCWDAAREIARILCRSLYFLLLIEDNRQDARSQEKDRAVYISVLIDS